jgi:hypothetical protein
MGSTGPSVVSGHAAWLAAMLIFPCIILVGTLLAIVLVHVARQEDRVDAIHAVAEVLVALLPWSAGRERREHAEHWPRRRAPRGGRPPRQSPWPVGQSCPRRTWTWQRRHPVEPVNRRATGRHGMIANPSQRSSCIATSTSAARRAVSNLGPVLLAPAPGGNARKNN